MTLGLTNGGAIPGTEFCGLAGTNAYVLDGAQGNYGRPVGSPTTAGLGGLGPYTAGVTTDPTKSGLIAKFSGLTLGTVPSEKLGNFYIRY